MHHGAGRLLDVNQVESDSLISPRRDRSPLSARGSRA